MNPSSLLSENAMDSKVPCSGRITGYSEVISTVDFRPMHLLSRETEADCYRDARYEDLSVSSRVLLS
jgi:hypothetical protein